MSARNRELLALLPASLLLTAGFAAVFIERDNVLSNVSFGLPDRHALNAAFLPMAMEAGLTSAIMSTAPVVVESVRGADLLLGHDEWGARWIAAHRARKAKVADAA